MNLSLVFAAVIGAVLFFVGLVLGWAVAIVVGACVLMGVAWCVRKAPTGCRRARRRLAPVASRFRRTPSQPPVSLRRGRHARPRIDPHPDVAPFVEIALCDPDTAELRIPHDLVEETAA